MVLGISWVNSQVVFDGVVQGLAVGVVAIGVVLIYRATRIINFAVGGMGVVGAVLLQLLTVQYHVPFWVSFVLVILIGLVFGAAVDATIIRRLRRAPRVVVLVATIGVAQLAQVIAIEIPQPKQTTLRYPTPWSGTWTVAGVTVRGSDLAILIFIPFTLLAVSWFLDRTTIGQTVKACATNPQLARTASISPKWVSTMVWALAAGISTLAVVLIAGQTGDAAGAISNLGPETLAEGLAAAVIAGMASFRLAVVAAIGITVGENLLTFNFLGDPGVGDLLLFLAVLIALWFYGRDAGGDAQVFAFTPRARRLPEHLRSVWWARYIDKSGIVLLGGVAILLPLVVTKASSQQLYTAVMAYAICASSLTVITGWLGQLSLAQMAFAGLGALFAARLVSEGVPFWLTIPIATAAASLLAAVVGLGALRVRGLYLAVVTFAFALTAQQYFYFLPGLTGESQDGATVPFARGHLFFLSFPLQRTYYYVVLAILVLVVIVLGRFRDSGVGRTIKAVRDNESAASAYTVVPTRTKIRAFALAGALAGLGGALLSGAFASVPFTQNFFQVNDSLTLVAIVVIGGMGSVSGAVIGAIWVIGIPALAPNNPVIGLLASSVGLLVVLLYFPRGLNQLAFDLRDAVVGSIDRRLGRGTAPRAAAYPAAVRRPVATIQHSSEPTLAISELSVRYGGIMALDRAAVTVSSGECVGLIGSNGAGKSTLMNAVSGLITSRGSVRLLGTEVGGMMAARRAALGLGRTFQSATLFPELTVNETLLMALEGKMRTGMASTALGLPSARRHSRNAAAEVGELITFLGLGDYRDHYVSDLSTGTRRVVELAGLLALNAKVLCLDEPTAGLAQRETEAFGPLIIAVQKELRASVLLIEHDMPLVMSISTRIYCLEIGSIIAEGSPEEIRNNPRVIASYLGTDERAITRSGTPAPALQTPMA